MKNPLTQAGIESATFRIVAQPHLVPRLKKEYSYTSTPPLGLRSLLQGELYHYLTMNTTLV